MQAHPSFNLESYLEKPLLDKLQAIKKYVERHLTVLPSSPGHSYFTSHGIDHLKGVMYNVNLLTEDLVEQHAFERLNSCEIFVLCAAVWLHDIGQTLLLNDSLEEVRKTHHTRSCEFVKKK